MSEITLKQYLSNQKNTIDKFLISELPKVRGLLDKLIETMRYSVIIGGKRLRPILSLIFTEIYGNVNESAIRAASAVELLHTYSLVHDDLPAMDNDDYRRGELTVHKKYGEAMAILCGDALLTLSFNWLSHQDIKPETSIKLIRILSDASGYSGMVGGQYIDMYPDEMPFETKEEGLLNIHKLKTAKLFSAACEMGATIAEAPEKDIMHAKNFGLELGLSFQMIDDILDVISTKEELGKSIGKDKEQDKLTFVTLYGLDKAKVMAGESIQKAINMVKDLPHPYLVKLCEDMANRTS